MNLETGEEANAEGPTFIDRVAKDLESVIEENGNTSISEDAEGEGSRVDDPKIGIDKQSNDLETQDETCSVKPPFKSEASLKSAHSEESGCHDCESGRRQQPKDLEVVVLNASTGDESFKSARSQTSMDNDCKKESSQNDLEMGLDASDTDETSATTHSKASGSEDSKNLLS